MVSQVQTSRLSQPFCPFEPHTVQDNDYAKPTIKDGIDLHEYLRNNALPGVALIAGSIFGGFLVRTENLGLGTIAALAASMHLAAGSAVLALDILFASNRDSFVAALSQNATNGVETAIDYAQANPITSALTIIAGLVAGNVVRYRIGLVQAVWFSTTVPYIYFFGKVINNCFAQDQLLGKVITQIGNAISESRQDGRLKSAVDYVVANPISTSLVYSAAGVGVGIAKYRGYNNPRAVGAGFLSATLPLVANHVCKTIYTSFTAQDGYCRRAITQIDNAISESKENGWIKDVLDYAHENPITTAASAIAGIAGSVFGPLYSKTAITQAGVVAYNAMMTATISTAAQNGPVAQPIIQAAYSAADNAYYHTILRQTLGIGLASGLSAAIVPHVVNYVGKIINNALPNGV